MAQLSQVPVVNDPTEPPEKRAAIGTQELRAKINQYVIATQLRQKALEEQQKATKELSQADENLQTWKSVCTKQSDELCHLKKLTPEAESFFSDFTPFVDIPPTPDAPLQSSSTEPELVGKFSVTVQMLKAASDVKNLEDRHELIKVMLQEKTDEVERLKLKLKHRESDVQHQQEKIDQLTAEIAALKTGMSPEGSTGALSPTGEPQLTSDMDTWYHVPSPSVELSVDPTVLQNKIKELTDRISELQNSSRQVKQQCDRLMSEVNAARRQLVEYEHKLQEEREKISRAEAERDVARAEAERQQLAKETAEAFCRHLTAEVARLEATIRQLEQQNLHSTSDLPAPADQEMKSDELFAAKEQVDEYLRDLTAERESHDRTKANLQSVNQQWQDVYRQLQAKKEELDKAKAEMKRMLEAQQRDDELLKRANIDKELIEGELSGRDAKWAGRSSGEATTKPRYALSGQHSSSMKTEVSISKAKPKRGTLEEDRPIAITGPTRVVHFVAWTCDFCSYRNTDCESLESCKGCTVKRDRVVSKPVQESGLTKSNSVVGSSNRRIGASRLEEDG